MTEIKGCGHHQGCAVLFAIAFSIVIVDDSSGGLMMEQQGQGRFRGWGSCMARCHNGPHSLVLDRLTTIHYYNERTSLLVLTGLPRYVRRASPSLRLCFVQLCPQLRDRVVALGAVIWIRKVAVELCASTVSN